MNLDTEFLEKLASAEPAPGGGGASAYAGALAAALAAMVGNLAVGKPKYADEQEGIRASLDRLAQLRARLLELVPADADAYLPLNRAYRMPRATKDEAAARQEAIQQALGPACDIPLEIMEACSAIIDEAEQAGLPFTSYTFDTVWDTASGSMANLSRSYYLNVDGVWSIHRTADQLVQDVDEDFWYDGDRFDSERDLNDYLAQFDTSVDQLLPATAESAAQSGDLAAGEETA